MVEFFGFPLAGPGINLLFWEFELGLRRPPG